MNHTWKIYDLKRVIADGVVTDVTYACESQLSGSSTRKIGELAVVGSADDAGFVVYEDLTQDIVLGWVTGSIDTTLIETENSASIAQQITARAAITKVNGKPWDN
tara:strand:- start:402 stop:716 length:315 start_codon:yes stop_codon:yes gene_type:complete